MNVWVMHSWRETKIEGMELEIQLPVNMYKKKSFTKKVQNSETKTCLPESISPCPPHLRGEPYMLTD